MINLLLSCLLSLFLLAGCSGFSDFEDLEQSDLQRNAIWPDPAISSANCPVVEQQLVEARALPSIVGKGGCGSKAPFAVSMLKGQHAIDFSREATLNCVMTSQLHRFFSETVQPLAIKTYGQPVASIQVAASYSCRPRNSRTGAKLSEHGRANAIDISAFTLADGRTMTVEEDWRKRNKDGRFLRAVNLGACRYFTTVIGPAGDKYHQNHFHFDHGSHGKKGTWRLCQ
ncbi:extensin family protein [uncultured Cohaesibacter sp.]|uniref:extensin-like domain-containing protein n=1 Tax=uncultured Cohaesibacter sp. TaxID=1002546 RepID=UPI00292DE807|nr:extensin family protein [uncultured Cohaesibacter sp.]